MKSKNVDALEQRLQIVSEKSNGVFCKKSPIEANKRLISRIQKIHILQ
jgi:hypothetical protein